MARIAAASAWPLPARRLRHERSSSVTNAKFTSALVQTRGGACSRRTSRGPLPLFVRARPGGAQITQQLALPLGLAVHLLRPSLHVSLVLAFSATCSALLTLCCALQVGACAAPTRCARPAPRRFRCTWRSAFVKRLVFTRQSVCHAAAKLWRCVRKQARAVQPGSATHGSADALRVASLEADGGLRAELLRFVQRKLFAEDACSQAAGKWPA